MGGRPEVDANELLAVPPGTENVEMTPRERTFGMDVTRVCRLFDLEPIFGCHSWKARGNRWFGASRVRRVKEPLENTWGWTLWTRSAGGPGDRCDLSDCRTIGASQFPADPSLPTCEAALANRHICAMVQHES